MKADNQKMPKGYFWLVVVCISFVFLTILFLSFRAITPTETSLLSVLLTLVSALAAWAMTHYYSLKSHKDAIDEVKKDHRENLRMYALKASEKVNNLSNELTRLSMYLDQELKREEYETSEEELNAKEDRLEGAIHIINTLKSVNDTSLSDWKGIIGDEISKQLEEREEDEEELKEIIEKVQDVFSAENENLSSKLNMSQNEMKYSLNELNKNLSLMLTKVSGTPLKMAGTTKKQNAFGKCPSCGKEFGYRHRKPSTGPKSANCPFCGAKLISHFDKEKSEFSLEIRKPKLEKVTCPSCNTMNDVEMELFLSSSVAFTCVSCSREIRAIRKSEGIECNVISLKSQNPIRDNNEVLEKIKSELPAQPWPPKIHRIIAEKLHLSPVEVSSAIDELMSRGEFKVQFHGKLYVEEKNG